MANEINNPERKPIWTNPYIDYLGKGLLITCSFPIYENNEMIGVVCIDIGLKDIQNSISDLSIEGIGNSFLIDEEGKIIYYPKYELKKEEQGLVVNDNIDLYASSEKEKQIFKEMISEKKGSKNYYDNKTEKLILYNNIKKLNWIVGFQVDRKAYYEENIIVNSNFLDLIIFSIFLIIILLIYFYNTLSKPIFSLVDDIQEMGNRYVDGFETNEKNDDEIKILDSTFKNLKFKLDEYIDTLFYKNNELQTIFDNMPGLLYIIDENYNLKLFNNKSEKFIIDNGNKLKNKKCYELLFNRYDICDGCPVYSESKSSNEIHYKEKIFSVSSFPIYNSNNTIREIIIFSLDKTEEILKSLELANAEKFALIGQISASVTHQLKNNISVIKGACFLLNEIESEHDFDITEVRDVLYELNSGIKDAENTVYSLLEFDKNGDNISRVNIISVIEQMLVIEKNNLYKNKITINKNYESTELFLQSRENSLKFIFSNLIRNAIEAMKDSGGYLTLKVFKNNNFIHIEVKDTGEGINENIKTNIFDPFFTTKEKGSGLGLWIVKEQVKKLNGHIYCESKKNTGTNFSIVFPIKYSKES
jgi:nitrogen-specific signal transduction histidine kinase